MTTQQRAEMFVRLVLTEDLEQKRVSKKTVRDVAKEVIAAAPALNAISTTKRRERG